MMRAKAYILGIGILLAISCAVPAASQLLMRSTNARFQLGINPVTVTTGLVHEWKFENNLNDSVGTDNATAAGTEYVAGKVGTYAIRLTGTSSTLDLPSTYSSSSGTIQCWVWSEQTIDDFTPIIYTPTAGTADFTLQNYSGNGYAGFGGYTVRGFTLGNGSWVNYAITWKAGTGTILYVNGVDTGTHGGATLPDTYSKTGFQLPADSVLTYKMRYDAIKLYNRNLSAAEVWQNYDAEY